MKSKKVLKKEVKMVRFSDEKLNQFDLIIQQKLEKAKSELLLLKESISNYGNNGVEDTSPSFKSNSNEAQEVHLKEENTKLAHRQEEYINNLNMARVRIVHKTYGRCNCSSCNGALMEEGRLKAVPHATVCLKSKVDHPSQKNGDGWSGFHHYNFK